MISKIDMTRSAMAIWPYLQLKIDKVRSPIWKTQVRSASGCPAIVTATKRSQWWA